MKIKLGRADARLLGIDDSRPGRSERSPRKKKRGTMRKRSTSVHTRKTKPTIETPRARSRDIVEGLGTSMVTRGDYSLIVTTRPHGPPFRAWFDSLCDTIVAIASGRIPLSEKQRILNIDPWSSVEFLRDCYLRGDTPVVAAHELIWGHNLPPELLATARAVAAKQLANTRMGPEDPMAKLEDRWKKELEPQRPWRDDAPKPNIQYMLYEEFFDKLVALVEEYRVKLKR